MSTLPYPPLPSSDDLAEDYLNRELRNPRSTAWPVLLSDEYATQTHRVLASFREQIDNTFTHRNADMAAVRARFTAGEIDSIELARHRADYEEWKRRAQNFRTLVEQRYRQAADAGNARRGYDLANRMRDVLLTLAEAVMEHRERVDDEYEPTVEDRILWARLSTLRVPAEARPETLEEAAARERSKRPAVVMSQ